MPTTDSAQVKSLNKNPAVFIRIFATHNHLQPKNRQSTKKCQFYWEQDIGLNSMPLFFARDYL